MDILDIFRHFYLNHLSPLWGYFYYIPHTKPWMDKIYLHIFSIFAEKKKKWNQDAHTEESKKQFNTSQKLSQKIVLCIVKIVTKSHSYLPNHQVRYTVM